MQVETIKKKQILIPMSPENLVPMLPQLQHQQLQNHKQRIEAQRAQLPLLQLSLIKVQLQAMTTQKTIVIN